MLHTRVKLPNEEAIMSRSAEIREAPVCVFKDPKSSIYLTHILTKVYLRFFLKQIPWSLVP